MKKLFLTSLKNISFYLGLSVFIGLIVGAYQLGITFFKDSSNFLYNSRNIVIIILTILLVIVLAILNDLILRFYPHINGSAIPYIELAIRENTKIDYKKGIVTIILNSFISTLAGFTLGSEGPSICLGGMSGSLFSDLFKRNKDINEDLYLKYMYNDLPMIDLLIRTGGEQRISNFMLWQLSYAEFYFPKTYFPAFDEKEFDKAILEYSSRDRRFGGINYESKNN